MGAPLREDHAVHIESLIKLEGDENATATMSAAGLPSTNTALFLLLDANPRIVSTPSPAHPHAKPNGPFSDIERRNLEEELDKLQEQLSQLKAMVKP